MYCLVWLMAAQIFIYFINFFCIVIVATCTKDLYFSCIILSGNVYNNWLICINKEFLK